MRLCGIGTAVPERSIAQSHAASYATTFLGENGQHQRQVELLYRRTGVKTRHSVVLETAPSDGTIVQSFYRAAESTEDFGPTTAQRMLLYEESAIVIATEAARRSLLDAHVDPAQVTHLITVSCTGFASPGVDLQLIEALPLAAKVARTHLGFMGCHGLMNALRVAQAFVQADPTACVLVCAVELCSLHQQYGWNAEQIVANALFADGAAAIVGMAEGQHDQGWRMAASGSMVLPDSADKMSWVVRDHGFVMGLSPQVPMLIEQHLGAWLEGWLAECDFAFADVRQWAIHPGGPRILQATQNALKLSDADMHESLEVLRSYGNMSSPTVGFILDRLRQAGPTMAAAPSANNAFATICSAFQPYC